MIPPIFILTKGHAPRMRTHSWLGLPFTFVVNDKATAESLAPHRCVIAPVPADAGCAGAAIAREFVSKLLHDGEWFMFIDDNLEKLTRLDPEFYDGRERLRFDDEDWESSSTWRERFAHPLDAATAIEALRNGCSLFDTTYAGLAPEENYYFRAVKWSTVAYVKTKFALIKNDHSLSWYPWEGCMFEDMAMTAQVLVKHGAVAVNKWMRMHNPYWEAGGIGSEDQRRPHLQRDVRILAERFPGLIGVRDPDHTCKFLVRRGRPFQAVLERIRHESHLRQ